MTGQASAHIEKLRSMPASTTLRDAAKALGLCKPYVSSLAKEAGVVLMSPKDKHIVDIRELASRGITRREAAATLGLSYVYVVRLALDADIPFVHQGKQIHATPRTRQMAALYKSGKTLQEIGDQYGVTRERVRQLITKFHNLRGRDGGKSKTAAENKYKREAVRNSRSLKKWGCSFAQYVELRGLKKPTRAYAAQRRNAIYHRGIAWELNLWQWWCIWQQSGKWEQRGRGAGYMMCRVNDAGAYAVGNVYIATGRENSSREHTKISGLPRGVSFKKGRYVAHKCVDGRKLYLGSYPTADLAHASYLAGERISQ